jgi:hypothetical protein
MRSSLLWFFPFCDDDIPFRALHNCDQFILFALRDFVLFQCLFEIVQRCLPLFLGDVKMLMSFLHGASHVFLRAASDLTY